MSFLLPLQRTGHYFMSRETYDQIMEEEEERERFLTNIMRIEADVNVKEEMVHITCEVKAPINEALEIKDHTRAKL